MKWLYAALLALCPLVATAAAPPSEIAAEYQVTAAGVTVGRIKESYARKGDTYTIRSVTLPEGPLKLLLDDTWELSSSGRVGPGGLQPLTFTQHRAKDGKRDIEATFDWSRGVMVSTYGGQQTDVPLPRATQDRISVMYQFMNLERTPVVEVPMTNGRKVEVYTYRFVSEARVETPAGTFDTIHYQRVNADPKERRTEVWLAKDRFNFPVRLVYDDPKGFKLEQTLVALQSK
jgi:hypothetical protein